MSCFRFPCHVYYLCSFGLIISSTAHVALSFEHLTFFINFLPYKYAYALNSKAHNNSHPYLPFLILKTKTKTKHKTQKLRSKMRLLWSLVSILCVILLLFNPSLGGRIPPSPPPAPQRARGGDERPATAFSASKRT